MGAPDEPSGKIESAAPWIALVAAVGLTASGEYQLAMLAGWSSLISILLPVAVDIYVIIAIRRHRDVGPALTMMVATNALDHLALANLFGTDGRPGHLSWWLIVGCTAIAPMVIWRIHRITAKQPTPPVAAVPTPTEQAPPVAGKAVEPTPPVATEAAQPVVESTLPVDHSDAPPVDAPVVGKPTKPSTPRRPKVARSAAGKRPPRRSLDEWVEIAGPIFHTEFQRLRRQPTASEFAQAIDRAGYGLPSDTVAKTIRSEILDRADVPALSEEGS